MGRKGILGRRASRSKGTDDGADVLRLPQVTRLCWTKGTDRQAAGTKAGKTQLSPPVERGSEVHVLPASHRRCEDGPTRYRVAVREVPAGTWDSECS